MLCSIDDWVCMLKPDRLYYHTALVKLLKTYKYYHLSYPLVAPVPMDYQKSLQKPELCNRKITSHHGL